MSTGPTQPAAQRRLRWVLVVGSVPVAIAALMGLTLGLGVFTFGYGQGLSYMRDDPAACANCHVMNDAYTTWQKSSHHAVATCNSCHLPHNVVTKWVVKSENGFFHSLAFTTGDYHDPIQIKPRNRRVTQGACLSCHADTVHQMTSGWPGEGGLGLIAEATGWPGGDAPGGALLCVHCHADVGHAQRRRGSVDLNGRDPSPGLLNSLFPTEELPVERPVKPNSERP